LWFQNETWVTEKWVTEKWVAEKWVTEKWVTEKWVTENWVTKKWVTKFKWFDFFFLNIPIEKKFKTIFFNLQFPLIQSFKQRNVGDDWFT
jgi:hypothetical protein